jgi:hypothetical protein
LRLSAFRFRFFFSPFFVIAGHSRSQNGVASLAYVRQSMQRHRLQSASTGVSPARLQHGSPDLRPVMTTSGNGVA